ncbi:heat shock protein 70 family protein, partial [Kipferlia bialata]|eukprot:g16932.t1
MENGRVGVSVFYLDEQRVIPCEQVAAMLIKRVALNSEHMTGVHPLECCIAVPGYFNQ